MEIIFSKLGKLKKLFLDLLFPVFCFGCGQEGIFLCPRCKDKLVWVRPICFVCRKWTPGSVKVTAGRTCLYCREKSLVYAFLSPFLYSDQTVKNLIHSLKYGRLKSLADLLGGLLLEYLVKFKINLPAGAILIPVPLSRDRFRVRGFNQSELIVRYLSDRLGIKSEIGVLRKIKKTKPQVELSAQDRRTNLRDSFHVFQPEAVKSKIVILVDDVKTTGSTLEEAAGVLRRAGAGKIWALAVAH